MIAWAAGTVGNWVGDMRNTPQHLAAFSMGARWKKEFPDMFEKVEYDLFEFG